MADQQTKPCGGCGGKGERMVLPAGMNAFAMSIFDIARSSVPQTCRECQGSGQAAPKPPAIRRKATHA